MTLLQPISTTARVALAVIALAASPMFVPATGAAPVELAQTATPTPSPAAPTERGTNSGLVERVDYINTCRKTNRSVEVFANTALTPANRVGTLSANSTVSLTGVLAPGRAQIVRRSSPSGSITVVGWVDAAYLSTCDTPSPLRACYGINVDGLAVRSGPSSTSDYLGALRGGSLVYATANPPREVRSPNTPPDFGRIWVEILRDGRAAWIARTGQSGLGNNATRLSEAECNP
jgi:hypothetical protein